VTADPQPSATTPTAAPLPCSAEPERWFDGAHRAHALAACLQCPARRWCAREALLAEASWGMWAGIWIDGRLSQVAHYLGAIATDSPATPSARASSLQTPTPARTRTRTALPQAGQLRAGQRLSVRAAVLARSSGQCEVMAAQCRLAADIQTSRVPGAVASDATSAAMVYATCTRCADALHATIDPTSARRLGYRVNSPAYAPNVPFYWRQCRWVLLGRSGELLDATTVTDIACAS
jgi:Transcription factor WhiB